MFLRLAARSKHYVQTKDANLPRLKALVYAAHTSTNTQNLKETRYVNIIKITHFRLVRELKCR